MASVLTILFTILICFGAGGIEAQTGRIADDEMNALHEIAEQVGKKDWDFNQTNCDENGNWGKTTFVKPTYNNTVNCTCSSGVCHITAIFLKGQDLSGVLPRSLAKLPYLKTVDFTRNYLNGTIPPEWASIKLEYLSVTVNRLSGPIPNYLGNITSLIYMSLENNMFYGTVPAELGNLVNLKNLILSANNLIGELPKELNNLTNLTELRLSSNNFTGKLPSFQSWKQLQKLELQASGFEGPIPPSISLLHNLTELRISNLNGWDSQFPLLENMSEMSMLMLCNCNISGLIPKYLTTMRKLKYLDLSFNRLEGTVPKFEGPNDLHFMWLTRNKLGGLLPDWIKTRTTFYPIDLSYNNFSEISQPSLCKSTLNLFRSFFSGKKEFADCMTACQSKQYSLHINCGGARTTVGNIIYEADEDAGSPAEFFPVSPNWGTSTTGLFWDTGENGTYVATNKSIITMDDSQLYTNARLSPLSLTYYGHCLANGKYTVTLHFAEIIFRNNQSFQSLGRRIFDVYIQDVLVLSDFNIENVAHGVDKAVVQRFTTLVKNNTIEIRFYWAGKGTRAVPTKGNYGPLISAISVESNFKPPLKRKTKIFIIVGVVALLLCLIFIILFTFWWKGRSRSNMSREQDLRGLELQTGLFTFRIIQDATNNFDEANKIGEGGFGSVYKGVLLDGTVIAVKQLSSKSKQGNREFVNEIGMISGLQHPNLVRLYGCCIERDQLLLVYEYMEKNSLARALFGPKECQLELDWPTRVRICIGIARGLAFLHEESRLKIVHRDIKATNILLDVDLNPKISDFGLAKLDEDENTHISTRIAGTIGYMAPEYALWGHLSHKADVYSFGIVALEIIAGKNNMKYRAIENYVCLLDWALALQKKGNLVELMDPKLGSNFNEEEAIKILKVALSCTNPSSVVRPTMSAVVRMLEGDICVEELMMDQSEYGDDFRFKSLRDKYYELQCQNSSEGQTLIDLSETARNGSSSTTSHDLYPISLDSH
ncbi:unnamed protein product [Camellia sinensis]